VALTQKQCEYVLGHAFPHEKAIKEKIAISRHTIDGAVVIYDMDDPPAWLTAVESASDENGNTPAGVEWSYGQNGVAI